jgi:predicted CopG family antitoxin
MSTRTIAVDAGVYDRLAGVKRKGESFSKVIDRLLDELGEAHTGRDILRGLDLVPSLSREEAGVMMAVVEENRQSETWAAHDLR